LTKIIIFLDGALCIKFRLENICVCVLRIVRIEQWMFLCIYTHNIKVMLSFGWTNVFLGEVLLTSTWMFTMETMTPHLGCGAQLVTGWHVIGKIFFDVEGQIYVDGDFIIFLPGIKRECRVDIYAWVSPSCGGRILYFEMMILSTSSNGYRQVKLWPKIARQRGISFMSVMRKEACVWWGRDKVRFSKLVPWPFYLLLEETQHHIEQFPCCTRITKGSGKLKRALIDKSKIGSLDSSTLFNSFKWT
jgi:hypothetical protein